MSDRCEGCDLTGSVDWHGLWLCPECVKVEQEEADPALKDYREWEARFEAAKNWPASERGDTLRSQVHWLYRTMVALQVLNSEPTNGSRAQP